MRATQQFWPHRLRWRMRAAAWMWPTYAAAVVVDAAILHFLPPVGSDQQIPAPAGLNLIGDVILASAVNLFLLALVAPWLGRRLHARRVRVLHDPAQPVTHRHHLSQRPATDLESAPCAAIGSLPPERTWEGGNPCSCTT